MSSPSWAKMAVATASTMRTPALSGGKRGDPVEYLTGLLITPIEPIDDEVRASVPMDLPAKTLECFVDGTADVVEGDRLRSDDVFYGVIGVQKYTWRGDVFRRLLLEEVKGYVPPGD